MNFTRFWLSQSEDVDFVFVIVMLPRNGEEEIGNLMGKEILIEVTSFIKGSFLPVRSENTCTFGIFLEKLEDFFK